MPQDKITELFDLINSTKDLNGVYDYSTLNEALSDKGKTTELFGLINSTKELNGVYKDVNELMGLKKKRETPKSTNPFVEFGTGTEDVSQSQYNEQIPISPSVSTTGGVSTPSVKAKTGAQIFKEGGVDLTPLVTYETDQKILSAKDKEINAFEILGNVDKIPDATIRTEAQAAKSLMLDKRKTLASKADYARIAVIPIIDGFVKNSIDNRGLEYFTKFTADGDGVFDEKKTDFAAKVIATSAGLPDDGYAKKLIYNRFNATVTSGVVTPKIEKKFNIIYPNAAQEIKKEAEDGFKAKEKIKRTAETEIRGMGKIVVDEEKKELDGLSAEYLPKIEQVNNQYKYDQSLLVQQLELNTAKYKNQLISYEEAVQNDNNIKAAFKKTKEEYKLTFQSFSDEYLKVQKTTIGRYNKQYERQRDEIIKMADKRLQDAAEKYQKGFKLSPELEEKYKAAWKKAANIYYDEREIKLKESEERLTDVSPQLLYAKRIITGLGTGLKTTSSFLGIEQGVVMGDAMENMFTLSSPEIKSWRELLNLSRFISSSGQMIGAMAPMIATQAVVATMTSGASIPTQLLVQGGIGFTMETMQNAGGAYEEKFAETNGNVTAAEKAARLQIEGNLYLLPFYALDGLPFISKATLGIKNIFLRAAAKGAIEVATEIPQEYPQGIFEELARENKGLGNFWEKATLERFENTAMNIIPASLTMGGAPTLISGGRQWLHNIDTKAFAAKQDLAGFSNTAMQQYLYGLTLRHGESFGKAYLSGLYQNGSIKDVDLKSLANVITTANATAENASKFGLTKGQSKVYSFFMLNQEIAKADFESAETLTVQKAAEQRMKMYENAAVNFLTNGKGDYSVVILANNEQYILTFPQMKAALADKSFAAKIAKGDVKITLMKHKEADIFADLIEQLNKLKQAQQDEKQQQEPTKTGELTTTADGTGSIQPSGEGVTPTPPTGVSKEFEDIQKGEVKAKPTTEGKTIQYLNPETGEKVSKEEYDVLTGTPTEIGGFKVTGEVESVGGERVFKVLDDNGNERYLTADGKELQVAKQKLTEGDIIKAADEANIEWDNDPLFMAKSKELTGKRHLSEMNQTDLGKMMKYVKETTIADSVSVVDVRTDKDFANEKESYRVIVGDEAFNDIVNSGKVRVGLNQEAKDNAKKAQESGGINLDRRGTTPSPSFSKGKASMEYAHDNPNHYIVVTEDASLQPSTLGRHGKGSTMFPTDTNGKHLKELDGSKVKVYKHLGDGKYELVYANGKVVSQSLKETTIAGSVGVVGVKMKEPTSVSHLDGWTFVRMPDGTYTDGDQIYNSWKELKKVGEDEGLGLKQSSKEREQQQRDEETVQERQDEILNREFKNKLDVWNYINDEALKRMGYERPMDMSKEDLAIHTFLVRKGVEEFEAKQLATVAEANKIIEQSLKETTKAGSGGVGGDVDNVTVSTKDKNFNKEEFVRDIDKLEKEKKNGSKNIGLYSFKDKFVKVVKSKRKLSKEDLNRLRDRVSDIDNVYPALEIIDLPNGSQAIVMDKASGKIGNELTQKEIDNIPQEHWDKFEQTIRELSKRGVQTDLTKRSNVLYDKDKGFQFIDLEGASIEGDATNKFFKKDGKEYYYNFEKYTFFPKEYKSAKEIFTDIKQEAVEQSLKETTKAGSGVGGDVEVRNKSKTGVFVNTTAHKLVGEGMNFFNKSLGQFLPEFITRKKGTEKNAEAKDEYTELTQGQANKIYDNLLNAAEKGKISAESFVTRIKAVKSYLETVDTPKAKELLSKLNDVLPNLEANIEELQKDTKAHLDDKAKGGKGDIDNVWQQRKQFEKLDLSALKTDDLFEAVEQSFKETPKVGSADVVGSGVGGIVENNRISFEDAADGKRKLVFLDGEFYGTYKSDTNEGALNQVKKELLDIFDELGGTDLSRYSNEELKIVIQKVIDYSKINVNTRTIASEYLKLVKAELVVRGFKVNDKELLSLPTQEVKTESPVLQSGEPKTTDKSYQEVQEANSIISKENPKASVLLQPKGDDLSLTAIYVGKEKRGKGIGSKALESVKKQADRLGKKVVVDATNELDSETDLKLLGVFYEKNGFTKVGENKYEYIPKALTAKIEREGLRATDKKTLTTILQKVFALNKQKSQMTATIFDAVAKSLKANFGIDLYEQMAYANATEEDINGIEHLKQESTVKDKLLVIFRKFGINQAGFSESTEWDLGKSIDAELKKQGLDLAYEAQRYGQGGSYGNWHIVRKGRGTHVNANYQGFLRQNSQGAYQYIDALSKIIYAITNPNVSTPIHELAHAYFDFLIDAAIGGNEQAIKDVQSALDFAGLPKDTNISKLKTNKKMRKKVHELFARGFEKYLKTGKAPFPALQKVFDNFKKWLTEIYNSVKGLDDIKLNKNIKDVYARMLTPITKEEQNQNKRAEEYGFKNKHHAINSVIKELGLPKETKFEDLTDEQLQQTKGIKDSREQSAEDQDKFFQSLGIDTNRGKDTITNSEVDLIKNQFKSWGRGFIGAMMESKSKQREDVKEIRDIDIFIKTVVRAAIRRLKGSKKITYGQVKALTKELLRVNSPKRMYEFLYFMDKVVSDIKYAENREIVKKLLKKLKRRGFPSAVSENIAVFISIKPDFLSIKQLEEYMIALEALNKKVVNVKPMNEIFDEIMNTQGEEGIGISLENRLARENKKTKETYKDDLAGYQEYLYDTAFEEAKKTIASAVNAFEDVENPTVEEYLYFKNRAALAYRQIKKLQLANPNKKKIYQNAIDALFTETQNITDEFEAIEKTLKDALIKEIANKKSDTSGATDTEVKIIEDAGRLTVEDLNRLSVEDLDLLNSLLENAKDGIIDLGLLLEVVSTAQAFSAGIKLAPILKSVPMRSFKDIYEAIITRDWSFLSTALDLPIKFLRNGVNSNLNFFLAKRLVDIVNNQFVSNRKQIKKFKDVAKRLAKRGERSENANKIGLIFSYLDTKYGGSVDWLYYILNPKAIDKLSKEYLVDNLKSLIPYAIRKTGWMKEFKDNPHRMVREYFQNQMDYMFPQEEGILNFKGNKKMEMMAKVHQELASLYGDGTMVDKKKIEEAIENRDADLMTNDMWAVFDIVQEIVEEMSDKIQDIASMKGKPITMIWNYMARIRIGGVKSSLDFTEVYQRAFATSSPTTKERDEDGISGRETDIEILMRHIITKTNKEHSTLFGSPYIRKLLKTLSEKGVRGYTLDAIEAKIKDSFTKEYDKKKTTKIDAIKRAFIMRILGRFRRTLQEAVSSIGAIWKTGKPISVLSNLFAKNKKLYSFINSSFINEISSRYMESGEGVIEEKVILDDINEQVAKYTISIGELIIKSGIFRSFFESEFLLATGEEFDIDKFNSDENYQNEHYAAIQESGAFAETITKQMIGGTFKFEGRGKAKSVPFLHWSPETGTFVNGMITFLSGYNVRSSQRFIDAINGKHGFSGINVVLGTIAENALYYNSKIALIAIGNYVSAIAKIALDDDDDDDEEQKKAALAIFNKEWERFKSPEFNISTLSSGALSAFFGAYGNIFGGIASWILVSTIYSIQVKASEDLEEQKKGVFEQKRDKESMEEYMSIKNKIKENNENMIKLSQEHFRTNPINFYDLKNKDIAGASSQIAQAPHTEAVVNLIKSPLFGKGGINELMMRLSLEEQGGKGTGDDFDDAISETTKTEYAAIGIALILDAMNTACIVTLSAGLPFIDDMKNTILSKVEPFNKDLYDKMRKGDLGKGLSEREKKRILNKIK